MNFFEKTIDYLVKLKKKIMMLLFYNEPVYEDDDEEEEEEMENKPSKRLPHNYKRYPQNIYESYGISALDRDYTCYKAKFSSLYDLYSYLKSEPGLNRKVFRSLHSVDNDEDFAGIPYEEAVEELINSPRSDFDEFLRLSKRFDESVLGYVREYETIKSPGGGIVDIPSYVAGDPLCYRTSRSVYVPKFIRVNISLSYWSGTTKNQVLNRALIISALIGAFEAAGYVVEVNTFEMSKEYDEVIYLNVNIKNNDESFNKASLYKSLCYVEFLRRILFRVLETLDVENDWQHGYGQTCSETFIRDALDFSDTDIFFDQPREMGVNGRDIAEDFENVINHLHLEELIDVESFKKEFRKDAKRLQKTIK